MPCGGIPARHLPKGPQLTAIGPLPGVRSPADDTLVAGTEEPAPEIRLVDLAKQYGEVRAVDSVCLDIRSGEFFSLLGPSGCGKTTTLRMIGGFEEPTSGRIELRGRDVSHDPPERRPVNMVFQNYALFPHLNVFDNVAFGLRRHKVPRDDVRRRTSEALELVRLTGFDRRRPTQLSGGQQQRVALARALVNRPTVLLLDEPLGALDLKLRRQLQIELKRIQQEVGITFVYVTHDQEEALTLSDRIAVMRSGRVEQLGTPEELYDRPLTRFVADFIGTTNLLAGVVDSVEAEGAQVRLSSGELCRVERGMLVVGQAVELAVRPQAIELRAAEGGDSEGLEAGGGEPGGGEAAAAEGGWAVLQGRVEHAAYMGTSVDYVVRTDGGLPIAAVVPRSAGRLAPATQVTIRWRLEDALALVQSVDERQEAKT